VNKCLLSFLVCLATLFWSVSSMAMHGHWIASIGGGPGLTSFGKTQTLLVSTQGIQNRYNASRPTQLAALGAASFGYQILFAHLQLNLGIAGYFVDFGNTDGTINPAVNFLPASGPLSYDYAAHSLMAMAQARLVWLTSSYWHPFILLALGASWNEAFNYFEARVPASGTSSPARSPYQSYWQSHLAYALGIGVIHKLSQHLSIAFGYRFVYAGDARLSSGAGRSTGAAPATGTLDAHLLVMNLLFAA